MAFGASFEGSYSALGDWSISWMRACPSQRSLDEALLGDLWEGAPRDDLVADVAELVLGAPGKAHTWSPGNAERPLGIWAQSGAEQALGVPGKGDAEAVAQSPS